MFTSLWLMESAVCSHSGSLTLQLLRSTYFLPGPAVTDKRESTITGRFPPGPASSLLRVKGPGVHLLCSVLRVRVAVDENARLCPRMATSPPCESETQFLSILLSSGLAHIFISSNSCLLISQGGLSCFSPSSC